MDGGLTVSVGTCQPHPNLWVNQKPVPKIDQDHPAYPTLQRIKGHLQSEDIKSLYGDTGMTARVARDELLKLAIIRNDRPSFLYGTSNKASRQEFLAELAQLRGEGVKMRNDLPTLMYSEQLARWEQSLVSWMYKVIGVLKQLDVADANWFETLHAVPPARPNS